MASKRHQRLMMFAFIPLHPSPHPLPAADRDFETLRFSREPFCSKKESHTLNVSDIKHTSHETTLKHTHTLSPRSLSHTHTHTLSPRSLSVTHAHTHAHTHTLFLPVGYQCWGICVINVF